MEKDKRTSKLFGGRISSIFNAHGHLTPGGSSGETGTFHVSHHTHESAGTKSGGLVSHSRGLDGSNSNNGAKNQNHIDTHVPSSIDQPTKSSHTPQVPSSPYNRTNKVSSPQTPSGAFQPTTSGNPSVHNNSYSNNITNSSISYTPKPGSQLPSPQVSSLLSVHPSPMRPLSSKPLLNNASNRVSSSSAYLVNLGALPYSPGRNEMGSSPVQDIPEHSELDLSPGFSHHVPRRKPPPSSYLNSEFDFGGPVYSTSDVGSPVSASKASNFEDELSNVNDFRDFIDKIDVEIANRTSQNYTMEPEVDAGSSSESSQTENETVFRSQPPMQQHHFTNSREGSTEPASEEDEVESGYRDEFLNDLSSGSKKSYIQPLERSPISRARSEDQNSVPYPLNDDYARNSWNDPEAIDSSDENYVNTSDPYPTTSRLSGSSSSSTTSIDIPQGYTLQQQQQFQQPLQKIGSSRTVPTPTSSVAAALGSALTPSSTRSQALGKSDSIRTSGTANTSTTTNTSSSYRVPYKGPSRQESIDTVSGLNTVELRAKSSISRSLGHRKTGSIASLQSMNSNRNVNLATLKKSFNLRPGEGERSSYVLAIRKSSGAANNDTGPGKWKLPTALQVIDKSAIQTAKYLRMSGGSKLKKSSGVELKHGHLERRLLRSEADGFDDSEIGARSPLARSGTETSRILTQVMSNNGTSQATILTSNTYSSTSSVDKTNTLVPGATNTTTSSGDQHNELLDAEASSSNTTQLERSTSVSSSSSGSISSASMAAGVYYQHPGYSSNHKSDEELNGSITSASSTLNNDEAEEFGSQPRLVLVNPDDE